ncbi:type IV pili methyl-accepting chemotaxis transducer N-terminal domain-containing protein [Massilia sp. W12]|uniref:type IV pili methyl-accepting chemotaxis transducer N-terminal domain-containing protein n=1 Tax=Massilia sp. W12 TaxID=3126507 RepID=UPI0030D1EEB1
MLRNVLPAKSLGGKIVAALLGVLLLALLAISTTLLLSWQLEGASAAINESGRLRMHGYQLSLRAERIRNEHNNQAERFVLQQEIKTIDHVFTLLSRGDPQRPLYLPSELEIRQQFITAQQQWLNTIRPAVEALLHGDPKTVHQSTQVISTDIPLFVQNIEKLVRLIEKDSEQRASWLRSSQLALITLSLAGTVALIYLMFVLIIDPVKHLQEGMQKMSEQAFDVRLQVESDDEFGEVTAGFNRMADRLSDLYNGLEQRVAAKTLELETQNRELALLYECASFLQQPLKMEGLCEGFLDRIRQYFGADGGSVRVLDPVHGNLHMLVHHGISADLVNAEHCLKVGDCLCGEAVAEKVIVIHDLNKMDQKHHLQCHKEGFASVSVFQIHASKLHLGFFNLHFRTTKTFSKSEVTLLDTLGQLLGVALQNIRLATRERALAISEERNLVAQGLHDSIAQGLNFLNIQVQMLEDSLTKGKLDEVAEIAPQLRAGIAESYEDVRELLQNFRSRLAEGSLARSLENTCEKFRRQTGIEIDFQADSEGAPLPREHQLQILFILQEALSNIRKHAMAAHIRVRFADRQDIELTVTDDGVGFDLAELQQKGETHVGLKIMRERAQRIGADFTLESQPGAGATVRMRLSREQRAAA